MFDLEEIGEHALHSYGKEEGVIVRVRRRKRLKNKKQKKKQKQKKKEKKERNGKEKGKGKRKGTFVDKGKRSKSRGMFISVLQNLKGERGEVRRKIRERKEGKKEGRRRERNKQVLISCPRDHCGTKEPSPTHGQI